MVARVIVLAHENPYKTGVTGGALEIKRRVTALQEAGWHTEVFAVDSFIEPEAAAVNNNLFHLYKRECHVFRVMANPFLPWPVTTRYSIRMAQLLRDTYLGGSIVLFEGLQMLKYLRLIRRSFPKPKAIILRVHNIESDYHFSLSRSSVGFRKLLHAATGFQYRYLEKHFTEFDYLYFISKKELSIAVKRYNSLKSKAIWVPPIAEIKKSAHNVMPNHSFNICYFGDLRVPSNYYGIKWFISHAWTKVVKLIPNAVLHIAGHGSNKLNGPRILGYGFVDKLDDFIRRCNVVVLPVFHGGGVKMKTIDTLGYGIPVIATPAAVEGTHFEDGNLIPVCNGPDEMVKALVNIYFNPAASLKKAEEIREILRKNYSPENFVRALGDVINAP